MDLANSKSEKVYHWLLAYIEENKFSENQKLPSENALRRRLNVSRETIRSALTQLAGEGLIYKVKGSGTYFDKSVAISRNLKAEEASLKVGVILQGQDRHANSSLLQGIKSVLTDDRVDLRVFLTDNKFANERQCLQTVMHQHFSGFIVDGVKASLLNPNLDCYQELYRRHIPVMFYNNYYKNLDYPRVIVNDVECADQLVSRLVQAGHRNIAGIFVYDNYQSIEKFQGMAATLKKYGVDYQDDYIMWCISNEAHDVHFTKTIERFLKKLSRCTAIVCCNYIIYCLVRKAIANIKKRVPEDYSLVCFDYSGDNWQEEGITCSVSQGYQIGREVGNRLLRMIDRKNWEDINYSHMIRSAIYEGNSIQDIR